VISGFVESSILACGGGGGGEELIVVVAVTVRMRADVLGNAAAGKN
jgi:hypothetical protein